MNYRFISFRTYGSGVIQYDSIAFMSEDMKDLTKAILDEVKVLHACGHDQIVVHSTCDTKTLKEWNITLRRV